MKLRDSLIDSRYLPSVEKILEENTLCTLATVDAHGRPYVNTAYYSYDENLSIYILTQPSTQHSQNVARNENVAITIFNSLQPWGLPHSGLQITGACGLVDDGDYYHVFSRYSRRYPEVLALAATSDQLKAKLESRFYYIRPGSIRLTDEHTFGDETHFDIAVPAP